MQLQERIAEGYTHSYLRTEQKIVVDHLRSGRIDQDEWQNHLEELEEITEAYLAGEMEPQRFLKKREEITKKIRNADNSDIQGLTKEEARNLYQPVRDKHEEVLKEAHQKSTSTTEIFYKTITNKLVLAFTQIKNL
ncbi:MAG: hypothetical protein ABEJ36_05970 [Candidatus Nanosalina sp.]